VPKELEAEAKFMKYLSPCLFSPNLLQKYPDEGKVSLGITHIPVNFCEF